MKKILALSMVAALAVACTKKNDNTLQDSNTMLAEPEATIVDSGAVAKPAVQTTVANDSAAVLIDSATAK